MLVIYFAISLFFIPLGSIFNSNSSSDIHEYVIKYDGSNSDVSSCSITESNIAKSCEVCRIFLKLICMQLNNPWYSSIFQIDFVFDHDISGPLFIYYEIEHFYQNHRRYVRSRSPDQLMGQVRILLWQQYIY